MVYVVKKGWQKRARASAKARLPAGVKALKMVKALKKSTKPEIKRWAGSTSTTMDTTGATVTLFNPAQGITYQTRLGEVAKPLYIKIRLVTQLNAGGNLNLYRILLVKGKKENGSIPGLSDVLTSNTIQSTRKFDEKQKYQILWDSARVLETGAAVGIQAHIISKYFKFHGPIRFVNDTTSIEDGGYYLMYFSDQVVSLPTLKFDWEIGFTDV